LSREECGIRGPRRPIAWGGPAGEESCRTPLRQRRSRRSRPPARSSDQEARGQRPSGTDLGDYVVSLGPPRQRSTASVAQLSTSTRGPRKPRRVGRKAPLELPFAVHIKASAPEDAARAARARTSDDLALLVAAASLDDAVPSISSPLVSPLRPAALDLPAPPGAGRSRAASSSGIEPVRGETAQPVRAKPTSPARRATSKALLLAKRNCTEVELSNSPRRTRCVL